MSNEKTDPTAFACPVCRSNITHLERRHAHAEASADEQNAKTANDDAFLTTFNDAVAKHGIRPAEFASVFPSYYPVSILAGAAMREVRFITMLTHNHFVAAASSNLQASTDFNICVLEVLTVMSNVECRLCVQLQESLHTAADSIMRSTNVASFSILLLCATVYGCRWVPLIVNGDSAAGLWAALRAFWHGHGSEIGDMRLSATEATASIAQRGAHSTDVAALAFLLDHFLKSAQSYTPSLSPTNKGGL